MESDAVPQDLGEFELIARLTSGLGGRRDVAVGVGDDAAVLDWAPGGQLVVTCDALVEDRHFLRAHATAEQIGRRALAVNLSDIAAMGAEPLFALVSLILPQALEVPWLERLYVGLRDEARAFSVAIVGGNIASTPGPLVVDITLIGRVPAGGAVLRSGGRPGDRLWVTGTLGAAAAGLLSLTAPSMPTGVSQIALEHVRMAYVDPRPRVAAGRILASSGAVTAMLDVSDGLASDLGHLCDASRVGAIVQAAALPVDEATVEVAEALGRDPVALALHGGDDYELLFALQPDRLSSALDALRQAGVTAMPIGWLAEPETGLMLEAPDGSRRPLPAVGWDHLRPGRADDASARSTQY
jgi:thiamine-monophosphate kinase